jgi:PKD repeat protein
MKPILLITLCCLGFNTATAQINPTDTLPAIVNYTVANGVFNFNSVLRPLRQIAGAPAPFYNYFWEFGDGAFSFEQNPTHIYKDTADVNVRLFATNNYDDGKRPPTRPIKIKTGVKTRMMASLNPNPSGFFNGTGNIALKSNCMPKPGDDMLLILGYTNKPENGVHSLNGTIALLYNDKQFANNNFELAESRTYNQETPADLKPKLSQAFALQQNPKQPVFYASVNNENAKTVAPTKKIVLKDKANEYRDAQSWHFTNLTFNQERFVFINLKTTPQMIKDTNAVVKISAVFIPDDTNIAPNYFTMELQIVASHDPNKMALRHSRMNYRVVGKSRELTYKIRFQNTGKGPAKKVDVAVLIPPIFNQASIKITNTKPKLIACDSAYTNQSCIAIAKGADSVHFIFKNIYLPGKQQKGVNNADSTMGFVEYKIKFNKKPKKLPIASGAAIVFDKNPPIYTNRAIGRFKMGLSPGIILGYGFPIKTDNNNYLNNKNLIVGLSLAPYAPHKLYWQTEVYMGLFKESRQAITINEVQKKDTIITAGTTKTGYILNGKNYLTIQNVLTVNAVPIQLRYNINKFLGVGAGALVSLDVYNKTKTTRTLNLASFNSEGTNKNIVLDDKSKEENLQYTNLKTQLFTDVQVGLVRVGPSIGFRYIYDTGTKTMRIATYVTWKF